jgi:hypothetical protein
VEINVSADPARAVDITNGEPGLALPQRASCMIINRSMNMCKFPNSHADPAGGSLEVEFSYSVKWRQTHKSYKNRMDRYVQYSFLPEHMEVCGRGWG